MVHCNMGPSNILSFLSFREMFHFHDGRKGMTSDNIRSLKEVQGTPNSSAVLEDLACSTSQQPSAKFTCTIRALGDKWHDHKQQTLQNEQVWMRILNTQTCHSTCIWAYLASEQLLNFLRFAGLAELNLRGLDRKTAVRSRNICRNWSGVSTWIGLKCFHWPFWRHWPRCVRQCDDTTKSEVETRQGDTISIYYVNLQQINVFPS